MRAFFVDFPVQFSNHFFKGFKTTDLLNNAKNQMIIRMGYNTSNV
mgnify:CR=1 FL=1